MNQNQLHYPKGTTVSIDDLKIYIVDQNSEAVFGLSRNIRINRLVNCQIYVRVHADFNSFSSRIYKTLPAVFKWMRSLLQFRTKKRGIAEDFTKVKSATTLKSHTKVSNCFTALLIYNSICKEVALVANAVATSLLNLLFTRLFRIVSSG